MIPNSEASVAHPGWITPTAPLLCTVPVPKGNTGGSAPLSGSGPERILEFPLMRAEHKAWREQGGPVACAPPPRPRLRRNQDPHCRARLRRGCHRKWRSGVVLSRDVAPLQAHLCLLSLDPVYTVFGTGNDQLGSSAIVGQSFLHSPLYIIRRFWVGPCPVLAVSTSNVSALGTPPCRT